MFRTITRWLGRSDRAGDIRRANHRARLGVQRLEDRANPVVIGYPRFGIDYTAPAQTGVVEISGYSPSRDVTVSGTATLLSSGRHVLTAAHVLTKSDGGVDLPSATVQFEHPSGNSALDVAVTVQSFTGYRIHPGWNGEADGDFSNDLAVLELPEVAPVWAIRHDLYRGFDEVGQAGTVIGYGMTGNGATGMIDGTGGQKFAGSNGIEWNDLAPNTLAVDLTDDPNMWYEALAAKGDSGGPLLIGNRIAGVCSYGRSGGWDSLFDIDTTADSDFNDLGFFMRASQFTTWIDAQVARPAPLVVNFNNLGLGNDGAADEWHLNLTSSPAAVVNLYRPDGSVVFGFPLAQVSSITLTGSGDAETFHVAADFGVPVTVAGGSGADTLHTTPRTGGQAVATGIIVSNGAVEYGSRKVSFAGIETLTVDGGEAKDNILVAMSGQGQPVTTVNGLGSGDVIRVTSTAGRLTLNGGAGGDTFTFDGDAGRPGSLATLAGRLVVNGGGDPNDTLRIDDTGSGAGCTYTIRSDRVEREVGGVLKTVEVGGLGRLEVLAGTKADTITVIGRPATALTIDAGAGYDVVTVGGLTGDLKAMTGLTVRGGADGGELTLNDRGNPYAWVGSGRYVVSSADVVRKGKATGTSTFSDDVTVAHSGFTRLTLNAGHRDDLIRVTTAAGGPIVTVNAGRGNDIVVGGAGGDILNGEDDQDILIGGLGADTLTGGLGTDVLIGGVYTGAGDDAKLLDLRAKWVSGTSYFLKITALRSELTTATVIDDERAVDDLWGGTGEMDWFWGIPLVEVRDREPWETVR